MRHDLGWKFVVFQYIYVSHCKKSYFKLFFFVVTNCQHPNSGLSLNLGRDTCIYSVYSDFKLSEHCIPKLQISPKLISNYLFASLNLIYFISRFISRNKNVYLYLNFNAFSSSAWSKRLLRLYMLKMRKKLFHAISRRYSYL